MTDFGEMVAVSIPDRCSETCPFCEAREYLHYHTKHGNLKNERRLATNLRASKTISSEPNVGNVYPLGGGNDDTSGWQAAEGVLEDFPVSLAAAPHHIIPGNASMAPSRLEDWTLESKGRIKEDIGYNIDGPPNGIFLPHLPEIYWTKRAPGTDTPMSAHYGQTWSDLSPSSKQSIGNLVMGETSLQMHYTDHDDPYVHVDNETTYDDECKQECNHLADFMQAFASSAKCQHDDGKLGPPYALVGLINGKSDAVRSRITGFPKRWRSWVSPLAQEFTNELQRSQGPLSRSRGVITRLSG